MHNSSVKASVSLRALFSKRDRVEDVEGVGSWVAIEHVGVGDVVELDAQSSLVAKHSGEFDSRAEVDRKTQIFPVTVVVDTWGKARSHHKFFPQEPIIANPTAEK